MHKGHVNLWERLCSGLVLACVLPAFSQYITAGGQRFLNRTETETLQQKTENASLITLSPLSAHAGTKS
uniref:Uncharacterized protein n=2 Tax=Oreochromis TaxID=8139 RepID=A0A669F3F9_ORENI